MINFETIIKLQKENQTPIRFADIDVSHKNHKNNTISTNERSTIDCFAKLSTRKEAEVVICKEKEINKENKEIQIVSPFTLDEEYRATA